MDNLYRFSPIKNEAELDVVVSYVVDQIQALCKKVIGQNLKFSGYLTIFAHYLNEFDVLKGLLLKIGQLDYEHNGPFVTLRRPIKTEFGKIHHLRVRQPDPYRYQVGCGDFVVETYNEFKDKNLEKYSPFLREIVRSDMTMMEFWHSDFDVLGYIVKEETVS